MRINLLIILLLVVGCTSNSKKRMSYHDSLKNLALSNFDQKSIPLEEKRIARMIEIVQPEIDNQFKFTVAGNIVKSAKKYQIQPQIFIALIDTESNFEPATVSSTGDLSIAQVNVEIWNKEFERLKMDKIVPLKLKENNQEYAIMMMGKILNLIKSKYQAKDRRWYARYHSNTTRYKLEYLKRIEVRMKMLDEKSHIILAKN